MDARRSIQQWEAETVRAQRSPPTVRTLQSRVDAVPGRFQAAGRPGAQESHPGRLLTAETFAQTMGDQTAAVTNSLGLVEGAIGQSTANITAEIRGAARRNELDSAEAARALHNLRDNPLVADAYQRGLLTARDIVDRNMVERAERRLRLARQEVGRDGTQTRRYATRIAAPPTVRVEPVPSVPGLMEYRRPRFAHPESVSTI